MIKVNIGRNDDQTVKIQDPMVSGHHAVLLVNSPSDIELVDIGSTNGTYIYINGQFEPIVPNKRYKVTPDTFVRFGPETQMHVRRLIPEEKRVDICSLRDISDNYNNTRLELQASQQSVQGLRGAQVVFMLIGTGIGGGLTALLNTDNTFIDKVLPWIISVVFVVAGILLLNNYIKKKTRGIMTAQQQNEQFYGINYVCPSCHHSFRGQHYENILASGMCPKCRIKFFDSTVL